ncbi:PadR family transcriptional regulator [Saliphagus sp. LR7]|uniref:PadR family transcriptional regulator n=1 Tax=Saliphagus sp. LR7 TaxID=2282654 RepID=UPI000DF7B2CF|nr:PadR family transcriptional regulator [Saliphagus sp. LR7]
MDDLTAFQRDLLFAIASFDKPSGETVRSELNTYYSQQINHGRLYPNLDTLAEKGLVEKGELDRRTNYYALSDAGEQAIGKHREWEDQHAEFL